MRVLQDPGIYQLELKNVFAKGSLIQARSIGGELTAGRNGRVLQRMASSRGPDTVIMS
jgi:hypothetical protein